MADTVRTQAAIVALMADNSTGDITAQHQRDFVVSAAAWAMQQLVTGTTKVAGADAAAKALTLTAGTLTPIDLSGATGGALDGNVVITFPAGTAGDTLGFFVLAQATVTSATFTAAPAFCAEVANGTVINNAAYTSASTGSGKWGLWVESELLIFRYVDATVGWQVIRDGRIPHNSLVTYPSDAAIPTTAWTLIPYDTAIYDVAAEFDLTANYATMKRAGRYLCGGNIGMKTLADGNRMVLSAATYNFPTGGEHGRMADAYIAAAAAVAYASGIAIANVAAAGTITGVCYHSYGSDRSTNAGFFSISEMLG